MRWRSKNIPGIMRQIELDGALGLWTGLHEGAGVELETLKPETLHLEVTHLDFERVVLELGCISWIDLNSATTTGFDSHQFAFHHAEGIRRQHDRGRWRGLIREQAAGMLVIDPLADGLSSGAFLKELHLARESKLAAHMLDVELQHGVLVSEGIKDQGIAGPDLAVTDFGFLGMANIKVAGRSGGGQDGTDQGDGEQAEE